MKMLMLMAGGVLLTLWSGCAADEGHPPVARIALSPTWIVENDEFRTVVTLDGTASSDPLDDPAGDASLSYRWTIVGDEHRFEDGGSTTAIAMVRFRGDRPATVRLSVTDADERTATAAVQLQLTVRVSE